MNEFWVITIIAFFFLICICTVAYLKYLVKLKHFETIVKLAESGGEVKPAMLAMLAQESTAMRDLRRGLFGIAIGVPVIVFSLVVDEPGLAAIAGGVPLMIGLAYLVVARISHLAEKPTSDSNTLA